MKKHTRDVFSVLEVDTNPPPFREIEEIIYKDREWILNKGGYSKDSSETFNPHEHGITSYYDFNLFNEERYRPLMRHIMQNLYDTYRKLFCDTIKFSTYQAWWTVYKPGAYIPRHSHSNSMVSGAYYFRQPTLAGPITFFNPIAPLINHLFDEDLIFQTAKTMDIEPKTGTLLMFPGWLEHETEKNKDTDDKIIVSYNLTIQPQNERLVNR